MPARFSSPLALIIAVAFASGGCGELKVEGADSSTGPVRFAGEVDGVAAAVPSAPSATVIEYGRSVEGRSLWAVRIVGPVPSQGQRTAALMLGASQGIEVLGFVDELPAVFLDGQTPAGFSPDGETRKLAGVGAFLAAGGVVYVVPTVNPDGLAMGAYANANGVNLNRDWADQTQPETRSLVEFLDSENVDLRLVVDYHIGHPRLLYPRADGPTPIAVTDLAEHLVYSRMLPAPIRKQPISLYDSIRDIYDAQPLCDLPNDCVMSPRCFEGDWNCDCLHSEEWEGGRCVMEPSDPVAIERIGLSNDFFFDAFGATAFVYEGDIAADYGNVYDHAIWWDRSLGYLATGEVADAGQDGGVRLARTAPSVVHQDGLRGIDAALLFNP